MRIKGLTLRYNVAVPPPAGPRRTEMLRHLGVRSLARARRSYEAILKDLKPEVSLLLEKELRDEGRQYVEGFSERRGKTEPPPPLVTSLQVGSDGLAGLQDRLMDCVKSAVDAFNYLEDDPLADTAHEAVHLIGATRNILVGCDLKFEEGVYWKVCPADLMHLRWGLSPGMTAVRLCSHCKSDIDECEHLLDRPYPLTVARDSAGNCSLCHESNCEHAAGSEVWAYPWSVVERVSLHEISMVRRPRDPLTRVTQIQVSDDQLLRDCGRIPTGEILRCHECWNVCHGFTDPWKDRESIAPAPRHSEASDSA